MTRVYIKKLSPGEDAHASELLILGAGLEERFGMKLSEKTVTAGERGKPGFSDGFPFFNFSNCRGYAVVALSDLPVGVDIERIRKIPDGVCLRYLHDLPESDRERILLWTRYESLGKLFGVGIPHSLDGSGTRFFTECEGDATVTVCTSDDHCDFEWV